MAAQPIHPRLVLTSAETERMGREANSAPLFTKALNEVQALADRALNQPLEVPVPKDAGGYTHGKHKQNYTEMYYAGLLFSMTKEERYAVYIRDLLKKYAELYPSLGDHPAKAGESSGRLFWQTLNETVWLIYTIQAYDCIYDWLKPEERALFEENIFRPMVKFFTVDHAATFDRMHNHGTWCVTAVGLTGYVLRDQNLVEMALRGTKKDGAGGFLKQLHTLFSPDGFYTEGAYYFRYAIMPFLLFAEAIENNQPELKIFEYRNQILKKAVYAGFQLTNMDGAFFPINDAMKEKTFRSPETVIALAVMYERYGQDPGLLPLAQKQGSVALTGAGLSVAQALMNTITLTQFPYRSIELSDGADGDEGGYGILRSGAQEDQLVLGMKYTGHGLSHGHYDKLSILLYDAGNEILQDYGAARFVNVESKYGGRYLPESKSFAMQTIAHNTVTVDGVSHYGGKISVSEKNHADKHFFSSGNENIQAVSAKCAAAAPGVAMQRTIVMVADSINVKPVIIDLFRLASDGEHQYDLPYYYKGDFLYSNVKYTAFDKERKPLGAANGYQHLWKEAEGISAAPVKFSWLNGSRYYTITSASDPSMSVAFTRIGAGDPNFNLRSEGSVILRMRAKNFLFASVIEPHGWLDSSIETSRDAYGGVLSVEVLGSTEEGSIVRVGWKDGRNWIVMVSNGDASDSVKHSVAINGQSFSWTGNYSIEKK